MTAHFDEMSDFVNQPSKKFTLGKLLAALGVMVLLIALLLPAYDMPGESGHDLRWIVVQDQRWGMSHPVGGL